MRRLQVVLGSSGVGYRLPVTGTVTGRTMTLELEVSFFSRARFFFGWVGKFRGYVTNGRAKITQKSLNRIMNRPKVDPLELFTAFSPKK